MDDDDDTQTLSPHPTRPEDEEEEDDILESFNFDGPAASAPESAYFE